MTDTKTPDRPAKNWLGELGILALLGTGFAIFGAFGTGEMPFVLRLGYWIAGFAAAWLALQAILLITSASARLMGLSQNAAYLLAVPLLAGLIAISLSLFAGDIQAVSFNQFAQIALLGLAIFALFWILYARKFGSGAAADQNAATDPESEAIVVTSTPLHDRLAPTFGPILALQAEDHYVRVIGADTSDMILINLSDAITEIGSDKGIRVHRGWWVALGAAEQLRRDGRNLQAILHNGQTVPISRANISAAKAAFGKPI